MSFENFESEEHSEVEGGGYVKKEAIEEKKRAEEEAEKINSERSLKDKIFKRNVTTSKDVLHEKALQESAKIHNQEVKKIVEDLAHDPSFKENFVTELLEEKRDFEGKLVRPGQMVIRDPDDPSVFIEDNLEERKIFIRNHSSLDYLGKATFLKESEIENSYRRAIERIRDKIETTEEVPSEMIESLINETRDVEGKLLHKGAKVLVDKRTPLNSDLAPRVMEDNLENRIDFVKNGFVWPEE